MISRGKGQGKQTQLAYVSTFCQIRAASSAISTLHLGYVSSVLFGMLVLESDWSWKWHKASTHNLGMDLGVFIISLIFCIFEERAIHMQIDSESQGGLKESTTPIRIQAKTCKVDCMSCQGTQLAKQSQIESSCVSIIGSTCAKHLASKKRKLDIQTPSWRQKVSK
jgi:hypothetical protein